MNPLVPLLCATAILAWPAHPAGAGRTGLSRKRVRAVDPSVRRAVVSGVGVLAAVILVTPSRWWCGPLLAVPAFLLARRIVPRPSSSETAVRKRALATVLDTVAACLRSGMAVGAALTAGAAPHGVDDGISGVRATLLVVAGMLALGADPPTAWQAATADPELRQVAAAATRSAVGGTALAAAFADQAAGLRSEAAAATARSAGRAGVLMAAPLGVCFLPAFLCLGLAPVVIGLVEELGIF